MFLRIFAQTKQIRQKSVTLNRFFFLKNKTILISVNGPMVYNIVKAFFIPLLFRKCRKTGLDGDVYPLRTSALPPDITQPIEWPSEKPEHPIREAGKFEILRAI